MKVFVIVVVAFLGLFAREARAWGSQGHQVVAGIAAARLTNKATQAIKTILNGQTLP